MRYHEFADRVNKAIRIWAAWIYRYICNRRRCGTPERKGTKRNQARKRVMSMKTYQNIDELPYTLSVEELAAFLGISRVGAYNLAHAKGFPTLRVGKRILVPRDRFLQWMDRQMEA
jgi:excisionase family DNA binding protein